MKAQIRLETPAGDTGIITIIEPSVMAVARSQRYQAEAIELIKQHFGIDADAKFDADDMSDAALLSNYVYVWATLKCCMAGFEIEKDGKTKAAELPPEWADPVAFCDHMKWSAYLEIRRVISEISNGSLIGRMASTDDGQKKEPAATTVWLTS